MFSNFAITKYGIWLKLLNIVSMFGKRSLYTPLFTEVERAVLQVVEEMTYIFAHGVSDIAYEMLKSHFTEQEITDIIICICHMNFLNRVGVSTKTQAL